MFELIRSDMPRYAAVGGWLWNAGFWAAATYRFGAWSHGCHPAPVRLLLLFVYKLATIPWRCFRSVVIPARARIGRGLYLPYARNIALPDVTTIGDDCEIHHEVTAGRGPIPGVPRIGNGVTVLPGAKLLGGIEVGDGARIGANAVATRDVPPGAELRPAPARLVPAGMVLRGSGGEGAG